MRKIFVLISVAIVLFSCEEKAVFVTENIIPSPKEFVLNNDKLCEINEIVVLETSDNLSCPQNKDEYYIKIKKGNVIIEGNEVWDFLPILLRYVRFGTPPLDQTLPRLKKAAQSMSMTFVQKMLL